MRLIKKLRNTLRRRGFSQTGAALVETAIILPLLSTLSFGVLEFGLLISDELGMASSMRAAVRVASTSGAASTADYDTLQAMRNVKSTAGNSKLQKIVIYRASSAGGEPISACASGEHGVANQCNVYEASDM